MTYFAARHQLLISTLGALIGGFLAGIYWPGSWLIGGTAGVVGGLAALGLVFAFETLGRQR